MAAGCLTWLERRKKNPASSFSLHRGFICFSERNSAAECYNSLWHRFPTDPLQEPWPHGHSAHGSQGWQEQTEAFHCWCFCFSISSWGFCKCPSALRIFTSITTHHISYHLKFISKVIKGHQCIWKDPFSKKKHIHMQPEKITRCFPCLAHHISCVLWTDHRLQPTALPTQIQTRIDAISEVILHLSLLKVLLNFLGTANILNQTLMPGDAAEKFFYVRWAISLKSVMKCMLLSSVSH